MTDSPEDLPRKSKTIVTEEALRVDPSVLGLPLARPWRRLVAIGLDGLLCTILAAQASLLLGFAAAYVLLRASARKPSGGYFKRSVRFSMRAGAAVFLFGAVLAIYYAIGDRIERARGDDPDVPLAGPEAGASGGALELEGMQALAFTAQVVSLHRADDEEEAREAAEDLLEAVRDAGERGEGAHAAVRELAAAGDSEKPWLTAAVEQVLAEDARRNPGDFAVGALPDSMAELRTDTLISRYLAARAAGDSASADSLRAEVVTELSADTVAALDREYDAQERRAEALVARVAALEAEVEDGPGLLSMIRNVIEDLGLGLGWFGLYFTATTALWRGQTPGKRLLGIRVISLTGKPIGWWASFERFGGYAAGPATGLLGFAQILWDDNRQGIHDKIAATAVIRDRPLR